jgi:hypothetical protein
MKTGKYKVSFLVDLDHCDDESDAIEAMKTMFQEQLDEDGFPDVEFELIEGVDLEYVLEPEEVAEVNFDEVSL